MNDIRATNPHIDTENPLVNKIINAMSERGRQIKEGDIVRIPSGRPLTGRNLEIAQATLNEILSGDFEEDDSEE